MKYGSELFLIKLYGSIHIMKQLTQQLKSGKMEILEVPFPSLNNGAILVRNQFSVISAGT